MTIHYSSRSKSQALGYQLFVPPQYELNPLHTWPLILFLHGIKKRGDDLRLLDGYGLTWFAERQAGFPFIVLTPQCPAESTWPQERASVLAVLDEVLGAYRIDRARVYLTGFSLGGHGAWDLAAQSPDRFAAVAPLAGWFDTGKAAQLKEMPVWAFHGEDDDLVSKEGSSRMVEALQSLGGDVAYTIYPGLRHAIMQETYENPDLYAWFMRYKK